MQSFMSSTSYSGLLLLGALLLALTETVQVTLNPYLLVFGILLAFYSSFIRLYKSNLLVRFAAERSVRESFVPPITIQTPEMMMQVGMGGFGSIIGRFLGRGYILASRVMELVLLLSGMFVSSIYLLFVHFGRLDPLPFLGAWLLIVGVILMIISKFPLLSEFTHGDALIFGLLDVARWGMDSLAIWAIILGLGYSINVLSLFLVLSIILGLEKIPLALYGLGQNEFIGEVLLSILSLPMGIGFIAILLWDVSRLVSSIILTMGYNSLSIRRQMRRLV